VRLQITAFDLAQRFIGTKEVAGPVSNAHILAMLRLDASWVEGDSVPWCSAFTNYVAWLLRLPRSKSLAARSWLQVGVPIALDAARPGFDVVILKRGGDAEPGPSVTDAPGHVGFFAGFEGVHVVAHLNGEPLTIPDSRTVLVLGGNQADQVSVQPFPVARVLGIRRLFAEQDA
jgi:uncharacterized protein (TIGR02594 family)